MLISDDLWAFSDDFESSLKTDFPVVHLAYSINIVLCLTKYIELELTYIILNTYLDV
jgi:hypothetical protein